MSSSSPSSETPLERPERVSRLRLAHAPAWVAGVAVVGTFVFWSHRSGGYDATVWMPGALFILALVVAVVVGAGGTVRIGRGQAVASLALLGFTAWSFLSMLWADVPSDAWLGASRTLLYASLFLLFVLLPWTSRAALTALGLYAAGITGVAALAVYRVATVQDDAFFGDGRLALPTGYSNANVALAMAAFWIALALATRREQPVLLRASALGAVAFLPQVALLAQSRAAIFAFPLTAIAVLIASPSRLRTLAGLAVGTVPLVVGWDVHFRVSQEAEEARSTFIDQVMRPSADFMLVSSAAALAVGLAWALLDRRLVLSPRMIRAANVLATAAVAAVVLVGVVAVARAEPIERVEVGWREFTSNTTEYEGASRYGSLDSQRWDHWRVAMQRFVDQPLTGIGAEQFAVDYLESRRSIVDSRYPHSLLVGIVSQLGVVGATLFAAFLVLSGWFAWPRRAADPVVDTVRLATFGLLAYWLAHASVDWFYEIPAVTAPVFAFAGIAAAMGGGGETAWPSIRPGRSALVVASLLVAAVGFVSVGTQYLAERELDRALSAWADDPGTAYERLDTARRLNPLTDEADVYAGAIAAKLGDRRRMRLSFMRALERNPHNWYAHLELALAHSLAGQRRAALRHIRQARELNPIDSVLVEVEERLERGETVRPASVDPLFVERIEARLR